MAELGRVQFGDATIEYEVQRSERRKKTVQITMDGGRVLVAAPSDTPDSNLEAIVRKKAPWILRQVPDSAPSGIQETLCQWRNPVLPGSQRPPDCRDRQRTLTRGQIRPLEVPNRRPRKTGRTQSLRPDPKSAGPVVPPKGHAAVATDGRTLAETDGLAGSARGTRPRPTTALGQLRSRRHPAL